MRHIALVPESQPEPTMTPEERAAQAITEMLSARFRQIEKRLDRLETNPEIAAILQRGINREVY